MAQYVVTDAPGAIDFECDSDFTMRTLQNVRNLLLCRKGEVPFDRLRGLDPALFDMPLNEAEEALLPELDRVMLWEPDAEVVSAELEADGDRMIIRCVVEIAE